MNAWIALVVGIFIGWIIEWIIDWRYWRRNLAAFYATETQLRNDLAAAQAQLAAVTTENSSLRAKAAAAGSEQATETQTETESADDTPSDGVIIDSADDTVTDVRAADDDATDADAGVAVVDSPEDESADAAPAEAASDAPAAAPTYDDLTKISGIGPVYRRKLHEAGIYTFAQLAAASPAELTAAVEPQGFQAPAFDQWIVDAGELAGEADASDAGEEG